jgi:NAD(P)-dependent dehydrogenase (short-subunit alcohol dehydrogenase family)
MVVARSEIRKNYQRTLRSLYIARHGRLDAMVNTMGGYAVGVKLWELDTKTFDQMLELNLRSGYALSRAAVRVMLKQGSGAIVNVAAKAALDHGAGAAAYAAFKAAAVAMIDSLAEDRKGTGIRLNTVLPSITDTEANRKAMSKADFANWPTCRCMETARGLITGGSCVHSTSQAPYHVTANHRRRRGSLAPRVRLLQHDGF